MSDSLRPYELEPTRFLCPWDSPGKNTGVDCHALSGWFSQLRDLYGTFQNRRAPYMWISSGKKFYRFFKINFEYWLKKLWEYSHSSENTLCVLYFRAVSQYFWSLAICDYFNFCQQEKELFSTQEFCYYNIIYM